METKLVMLCIILCSGYAITHSMDHKNKLGSQTNSSTQRKRSAAQISSEKESQRSENQLINHIVPSVALDSELPEEAHPNPKKRGIGLRRELRPAPAKTVRFVTEFDSAALEFLDNDVDDNELEVHKDFGSKFLTYTSSGRGIRKPAFLLEEQSEVVKKRRTSSAPSKTLPTGTTPAMTGSPESPTEKLRALCMARSLDQARDLIERGASLDEQDEGGTALHHAAKNGDLAMVLLLLEKGAQVNAYKGLTMITPLALAAEQDHDRIIQVLLDHGALVND